VLKALLGRWLGEQNTDITQLIKKDLLLVQEVVDLDKLSGEEKAAYLLKAHELWVNPVFHDLVSQIAKLQQEETMQHAQTEKQLWAGKCNLVTTSLFRDEAQRLDGLYESSKGSESVDQSVLIP